MAIVLNIISLAVNVPVLSVNTQSTRPSCSTIEELRTPQYFLNVLSYSLLSIDMNIPEKVLIPSIKILRVTGIRKLSNRNMVKNIRNANITNRGTLKRKIESISGYIAIAIPEVILGVYDFKAHT